MKSFKGLFDFVKNIGEKIMRVEDEPAQKIKDHIESRNPGIKDLNVDFKDGQASGLGRLAFFLDFDGDGFIVDDLLGIASKTFFG